jgi:hypothetical protein
MVHKLRELERHFKFQIQFGASKVRQITLGLSERAQGSYITSARVYSMPPTTPHIEPHSKVSATSPIVPGHVCICMYMYVYVYVCICMYMYVYVCMCMYVYVNV